MKRIIEVNLILGIWLIVAPFVLMYATGHIPAVSNDIVVGILLVGCSLWVLGAPTTPLTAIAFESLCGAWLIAAPFAFHERALRHAFTNNMIVGGIILLVCVGEEWMLTHGQRRAA